MNIPELKPVENCGTSKRAQMKYGFLHDISQVNRDS